MKINFIVNKEDYNSTLDTSVLGFLFKKIKDKTNIKVVDVNNFKCDNASINFFLGTINNLLLKHAKFNILVLNNQTFKRSNTAFLNNFDYIFCKSKVVSILLEQYVDNSKIKYISWRSTDLTLSNSEKDFNSVLLYCYDRNYTQYNTIINNWKESYPTLQVVNYEPIRTSPNIVYNRNIDQIKYEKLFNTCGFHLCLQECDCFAHNINQCCLVKSVPIFINSAPMNEITNKDNVFSFSGKKKKLTTYIGNKSSLIVDNLHDVMEKIKNLNEETFENMGERCRNDAIRNHSLNDSLFKTNMKSIIQEVRTTKIAKEFELKEYPNVSIVTLTHNRLDFFDLSVFNFNNTNYPKDKIEWIIYDTSIEDEKVDKKLPPLEERNKQNIKYYHDTNKLSVGEKRNRAVSKCNNDIILFMDDDDYYYDISVKQRVTELMNSGKGIVGCTILGCFNINKGISFIESSNMNEVFQNRVSVATLCFYKSIWEKHNFEDESINEAHNLVKNNLQDFHEISWENIIVSLVHKYNLTNRVTPNIKPNGNYYGFSKGLFNYLIELQK